MFTEMLQTHFVLNVMTCFIQGKKKLYCPYFPVTSSRSIRSMNMLMQH